MIYCFDTSAFIGAWVRLYPIDIFPPFWDHLDELMNSEGIIIIEEVVRELDNKQDELVRWVKERPAAICELDEESQMGARKVLAAHPKMMKIRKQRPVADPFVVGLAQVRGAVVVTDEHPTGKLAKPTIPDVCDDLGIGWTNILGFIRQESIVFK